MSEIVLDGVSKVWGRTVAVDGVTLVAPSAQLLVFLGPSGCGKSTTLRLIAGLEEVTSGRILIDGADVTERPPSKRRISMVFQSYALFPHFNVRENIVFGLKVRKVERAQREARLARVAELVGLSGLLERKPSQLSGGQRQRVALARAIIAENAICLMDEPLSNLDAKLRHEMRLEIRDLQRRLGMTVIYVTHDQAEAMSLADKVALLLDGRIVQEGSPETLYDRPANTFVASFIGTPAMNLIDLRKVAAGDGRCDPEVAALLQRYGSGITLGIRPEDIEIGDRNGVPAKVISSEYLGADTIVTAEIAGQVVSVRQAGRLRVPRRERVRLAWASGAVHLFSSATGERVECPETGGDVVAAPVRAVSGGRPSSPNGGGAQPV